MGVDAHPLGEEELAALLAGPPAKPAPTAARGVRR
jgi:hypothetical protein